MLGTHAVRVCLVRLLVYASSLDSPSHDMAATAPTASIHLHGALPHRVRSWHYTSKKPHADKPTSHEHRGPQCKASAKDALSLRSFLPFNQDGCLGSHDILDNRPIGYNTERVFIARFGHLLDVK